MTGAARGLGAAIAVALAAEGVEPILLGRSVASLDAVAAQTEAVLGRVVRRLAVDVSDWRALDEGLARTLAPDERLGGVVNNAGVIDPIDRVEDSDPAQWAQCIAINLTGAYNVLRACLPRMGEGGVIANITSGAAGAEHAGWSAYSASKAGLDRLSATLAGERPDLVVLAVRPGVTATDMQTAIKVLRVDNAIRQMPSQSMQPPEAPARAIARLIAHARTPIKERIIEARAIEALLSAQ